MTSNEHDLIARYFRPLATDPGAFGLMDDAAALTSTGDDLVVTTDAIVEGVHFLPDDPPDTLARKALRVNLSDLAAKGARPAGFLLTLALRDVSDDWLLAFAHALGEDSKTFGCALLGGDTVSTPGPAMMSVTAFGRVPPGRIIRRDGASVGDVIAVTGTIGDAALGLRLLNGKLSGEAISDTAREFLIGRYRVPQPRNALADILREHASAAMDVSDGLAGDLAKLCAASAVSATVDLPSVPLSISAREVLSLDCTSIEDIVAGGDDYEVLCTVSENRWPSLKEAAASAGVAMSCIGSVVPGTDVPRFIGADGKSVSLKRLSYSHF